MIKGLIFDLDGVLVNTKDLHFTALNEALKSSHKVLPIFIFDDAILKHLPKDDARVNFIYNQLLNINQNVKILYV